VSWQDRQYYDRQDYGYDPTAGGARSWLGGLPAPTRVIKGIILANVAMFLLCQFTGQASSPVYRALTMRTDLVLHGQVWRLFTFTYLHDQTGLGHIFFNMLGLYFLGLPLEQYWGGRRFFVFYTLAGFIAVSLYLLMTTVGPLDLDARLVGASGGVLAVLGACAVLFPQFRIIMVFFPVPIRTAALIFVILYTFNLLNQGANAGGDACHLTGLAFGVFWAYRGHLWMQGRWRRFRRGRADKRRLAAGRQRGHQAVEVDRILEKVQREGINSLNRRERQALADATRQQQTEQSPRP
jgi:membrane associated rhomboid family serine protease